jgi:ubiquinone/menaquinone biosynthesis C-methylase UbiE
MMLESGTTAKEQFNRQAEHYDRQWNAWNEESLRWLLTHACPGPQDRVLDVATGGGFTALAFAPLVSSITGLDVAARMLEQASRRADELGLTNVRWLEGAAESLPFPSDSFEVVTCRIAPHHFESVPAFLREASRVLVPGGRILIADSTVPDDDAEAAEWQNEVERLRDGSHRRNFTPREWRAMIEGAALSIVELHTDGAGIRVPFADWVVKSGCSPSQVARLTQRFLKAPPSAQRVFQITNDPAEGLLFSWQRVLIKALRPEH